MAARPMMAPRHQTVRRNVLRKLNDGLKRYSVNLLILATTLSALFFSWSAMEIEASANRNYDNTPKSGTSVTCFLSSPRNENMNGEMCEKIITDIIHRTVVYYGVRVDCILSSPLILISIWFIWQESFGNQVLKIAFLCAAFKFIAIFSVLLCILMDDPSFMREIFEKSHFGTYEARILYSFVFVITATLFNASLLFALGTAYTLKDTAATKYRVGPSQSTAKLAYHTMVGSVLSAVAKGRNSESGSSIEVFPIGDLDDVSTRSNPV
ncbi:unnamed protein product [Caenorhabditis nigoni]|uniref:Uncharacterized protein n=1 Tax=Caenorhabditis nigoni TaxID=1611254 RepID=A0A2G5SW42_9PELO|nr:hypothetical protein B9Z55_024758 [Caenorhabditis nigoni]